MGTHYTALLQDDDGHALATVELGKDYDLALLPCWEPPPVTSEHQAQWWWKPLRFTLGTYGAYDRADIRGRVSPRELHHAMPEATAEFPARRLLAAMVSEALSIEVHAHGSAAEQPPLWIYLHGC